MPKNTLNVPSLGTGLYNICDAEMEGKTNDWTWIQKFLSLDTNTGKEISNFRKKCEVQFQFANSMHTCAQALIKDKVKICNVLHPSVGGAPPPSAEELAPFGPDVQGWRQKQASGLLGWGEKRQPRLEGEDKLRMDTGLGRRARGAGVLALPQRSSATAGPVGPDSPNSLFHSPGGNTPRFTC